MPKTGNFDQNVNRYDSWFERHGPAYASELSAFRDLLPGGGKGLEIGVGTGRFAAPLGVRLGVDPSFAMVRVAIRRGIEVVLGVGESLPYKCLSIDFALLVTTVCFLDDVPGTIGEVYRVLREGGYILIGFINQKSMLGATLEKGKKESVFYRDATFLSVDEIIAHLKQAGFRDFLFRQTIFKDPAEMMAPDLVRPGYDEGLFLVVRGMKPF